MGLARTVVWRLLAAAAGVFAVATAEAQHGASIAGVEKVIAMLTDMTAKAKQEKAAEEVTFAKFTTWCSQESASFKNQIAKGTEELELLETSVGKLGSDIGALGEAIGELQHNIATFEADKKSETAQREKDHEEFRAEEQDYSESVDAIDRAVSVLKEQHYDRPAASAALVQVSTMHRLPEEARSVVGAFLGLMGKDSPLGGTDYDAPEANAYESQSGNIIEMLKRLSDEFRLKLAASQKEEMNSKHAYDMIVHDLTDSIENSKRSADEKTVEKERKTSKKALDKKQFAVSTAVKADNEKMLADITAECEEKKLSFAEKQKLRAEEIEAMAKAIEILRSPDVMGNAEKHLALAQVATRATATAFLQRVEAGAAATRTAGVHRRLREFLTAEGKRLRSKDISLLADKVAADPFAKVKKLIDSLLTRLLEEAKADADHEGFCDTELGKSKVTRNKLSEEIDGLNAAVEDGKATILMLTESTAQLMKDLSELGQAMAEATTLRTDEQAKNKETVADAKAAQAAVAAATAVLKEFYKKASTATALLQLRQAASTAAAAPSPRQWGLRAGVKMGTEEWKALANPAFEGAVDKGHKEGMQTFGEQEEGQQDEAQYGVLGLLEVILSDFANLEADANAAEAVAAEAYERFMVESKKNKATKARKVEMNNADKAAAEAKLQQDIADLKGTHDELLAAERYYDKLVPQCMDQGMTWEERVAAREAEIASLKEALHILSGSDIA